MNGDTCFYFSVSLSLSFTLYLSFLPQGHIFENSLVSEKQEIVDLLFASSVIKPLLFNDFKNLKKK